MHKVHLMRGPVSICLLLAGVALAASAAEPEKTALVVKDLSTWRGNTGEWQIVGDVKIDPANPARLAVGPGTGILYNGPTGRTCDIFSHADHGDVEVHVEFMIPKGSNSGVYLQGRYEVQIFDSWGVEKPTYTDCGGIYQRWANDKGFEGHAPRVNAARAPGEWQEFDIVFQAPRFDAAGKKTANARFVKVVHNGQVVHENVEVTGPTRAAHWNNEAATGPLLLQGDHGPVAFRNIQVRKINLP
jgi:hypothetical protein